MLHPAAPKNPLHCKVCTTRHPDDFIGFLQMLQSKELAITRLRDKKGQRRSKYYEYYVSMTERT